MFGLRRCKWAIALCVLLSIGAIAQGASATFGRGQSGDYAIGKMDMVSIGFSNWMLAVYAAQSDTGDARIQHSTDGYETNGAVVLIGFANLFDKIPTTSGGGDIVIDSAYLEILGDNYNTSKTYTVSRMLSDWLLGTAGTNEDNVNADSLDITNETEWATDADSYYGNIGDSGGQSTATSWGSSDYTSTNAVTQSQGGWETYNVFDITDMLQDAYDNVENYGFVIHSNNTGNTNLQDAGNTSGNFSSPTWDPQFRVTYHYSASGYTLTVNSGTGDGTYSQSQVVNISANAAGTGQQFSAWTGDTSGVASTTSSSTTITMPASNATITATYSYINYTLTVNSGTGDGSYTYTQVANVAADSPTTGGYAFDAWVGDTSGLASTTASSTTLTMPASNATITATYATVSYSTATFGRGQSGDYAIGKIDMVGMNFAYWSLNVYGGQSNTGDCTIQHSTDGYETDGKVVLIGFANLFDKVATSSGGNDIIIDSATLEIISDSYDTSKTYTVSRMLSDWLLGTPGTNEDNVNADALDITNETEWATDADSYYGNVGDSSGQSTATSWGSSDYTSTNAVTETQAGWETYNYFDITDMLQDAYDNDENYGFVIHSNSTSYTNIHDAGNTSGNFSSPTWDAKLIVVYYYGSGGGPTNYTLTVNSGTGDGSYTQGQVVNISADSPSTGGWSFSAWTGDTSGIASTTSSSTTITMPGSDATITATYTSGTTYTLTVNSGTGGGSYTQNHVANISADSPSTGGWVFDDWIGDTSGVGNIYSSSTTYTMGGANATITATYKVAPSDPIEAKILVPWVPFDGTGKYVADKEEDSSYDIRTQELDAIVERWGQKPYSDLQSGSDPNQWVSERAIFYDIQTGATIYRLTNGYGGDSVNYHRGAWNADGSKIVWLRPASYDWQNSTTDGIISMDSDGTDLRRIGHTYNRLDKHQCDKKDPNLVYIMAGNYIRVFNIFDGTEETGHAVNGTNVNGTWHLKMALDGDHLLAYNPGVRRFWTINTSNGNTTNFVHTLSENGVGIHDSFLIHPTLDLVIFWEDYRIHDEGAILKDFNGNNAVTTYCEFDWNHGDFGIAPLPGTSTAYASGRHNISGWYDMGSDAKTWDSTGTNIVDPAKGSNYWGFDTPYNYTNGYSAWDPYDEPWIVNSKLYTPHVDGNSYVSDLRLEYVFPVTDEAVPRFKICNIGNRTDSTLDGGDGSPDGTKVLFNSNNLWTRNIYYVIRMLPEKPVSVSASQSGSDVSVSWTASKHSKETKGYNVYRSTASGNSYSRINSSLVTGTSYTDTGASGGTYYYVVTAVEHSGLEGTYSDEAAYGSGVSTAERTVFVEAEAYDWDDDGNPAFWPGFQGASSNLYYIWQRDDGINATAAISVDIPKTDSYYIWARIKEGDCTVEGKSFSSSSTSWEWKKSASTVSLSSGTMDLDVNSTDYGACIDAIYLTTDSSFTPSTRNAMDSTAPSQISTPSGSASGAFKVNLSWTASSASDLHHYNVYASRSSSSFTCDNTTLVASPDDNSYLDWQCKPGTTYYYKVTAVDRQGNESTPSSTRTVTTNSITDRTVTQTASGNSATLNIPATDDYVVWIQLDKNNTNTGTFLDVTVDGTLIDNWNSLMLRDLCDASSSTRYSTDDVWLTYGPKAVFNLASGNRTISVTPSVSGVVVKTIKVTNDFSWKPSTYYEGGYGYREWSP